MALRPTDGPYEPIALAEAEWMFSRADLKYKHPKCNWDRPFDLQLRGDVDWNCMRLRIKDNLDHFHAVRVCTVNNFISRAHPNLNKALISLWSGEIQSSDGSTTCIHCELSESKDWKGVIQKVIQEAKAHNWNVVDENAMKLQEFCDARVNPCALKPAKYS